jgi:outer membrane biogenesis lipoprotein LolB
MKIATSKHILFSLCALILLNGCAGKTQFRSACANETKAAWAELDIAKADGFAGTVSYTKAFSLLTAARTMQTVENFDNCYRHAKDARFYIRESRKGQ